MIHREKLLSLTNRTGPIANTELRMIVVQEKIEQVLDEAMK